MDRMEMYYEKAREIGEMILASEESKYLADCQAVFDGDEEAKSRLAEYTNYQRDVQVSMENGVLDQESFKKATAKLQEMGAALKKHQVVGELIKAETEFNFFVNQIMQVIKNTVMGVQENSCGGECGGCSGCGHSH